MKPTCSKVDCRFYQRFAHRNGRIWVTLVQHYCHGRLFSRCQRLVHFQETGKALPEDIMPSGEKVQDMLLRLESRCLQEKF